MADTILAGRTAIITGSTSGIGAAMAELFSAEGANIVLNGIESVEHVAPQLQTLQHNGRRAIYHAADMRDPAHIADLIATAQREFGHIDILINNAGIQHKDRTEDFPHAKWQAVLDINLSAAFYAIQQVIPLMRACGFGRIINTASAHGLVASPEKSAYVAAKHGLIGLTKVVALENADTDITVNALCPGWVETDLVKRQVESLAEKQSTDYATAARNLVAEKQPNGQFATPEAIARAALHLADPANRYMTGTQLVVDGGWTAR